MTLARLKGLERLEARQPRGPVWRDSFDAAMRLWDDLQAVTAGRAEWMPSPEPEPLSEEAQAAFGRTMAQLDAVHFRLTAKPAEESA